MSILYVLVGADGGHPQYPDCGREACRLVDLCPRYSRRHLGPHTPGIVLMEGNTLLLYINCI